MLTNAHNSLSSPDKSHVGAELAGSTPLSSQLSAISPAYHATSLATAQHHGPPSKDIDQQLLQQWVLFRDPKPKNLAGVRGVVPQFAG